MRLLSLLLLVGCGGGKSEKSIEQLRTEHLDKVRARLQLLPKIATAAEGVIDESAKPSEALDFSDTDDASPKLVNAIAVQIQDLGASDADADPPLRFAELDDDHVRMAKRFAGVKVSGSDTGNWAYFEYMLKDFEDAKFVLVVKPTQVTKGSAFGTSFTPGTVSSTNVLVDLATMKAIGSFTVTATNDEKIILGKYADKDPQPHVDKDLGANWGHAIAEGIGKRWPNSKTPWNWGLGY
jgi:hypothetical protein